MIEKKQFMKMLKEAFKRAEQERLTVAKQGLGE